MKIRILGLAGCLAMMAQFATAAVADDRLRIYTVNYPLQYFAQRIAGDDAEVVFPAPGDIDPAFWKPDVATVGAFQGADLILLNGANYAKWINRVSLPRRRLVDTSAGFAQNYIDAGAGMAHSHGGGEAHAHAGIAFTTWLDFKQSLHQADAIRQAIISKRPQLQAQADKNFARLESDLLALDAELKTMLAGSQDQALFASHPVYQYLARRYGVNLYSVVWEPDEFPAPSEWKALHNMARTHAAKWMLWEAEPNAESVEQLKQMGIGSIVFDPCANPPAQGDFLSVMKNNLAALQQIKGVSVD